MASYGSADNVSLPQQQYILGYSAVVLLELVVAMLSLLSPPRATEMPTPGMLLQPITLASLATTALLLTTPTP